MQIMRDEKDVHKYGERGEKVVYGPLMDNQGRVVAPGERKGQTGSSGSAAGQSDTRILPKGGSSSAPPKSGK
jgi:hypothetical protein